MIIECICGHVRGTHGKIHTPYCGGRALDSERHNVRLDVPKSPTLAESQLARIREIIENVPSYRSNDLAQQIAAVLDWTAEAPDLER